MEDFTATQSSIQSALISTTRAASQLANEDLPFHRSLDTRLTSKLDRQNARLLGLASRLLGAATATEESVRPPPTLKDVDAVDGNWRAVVDVVDSLLERADTALDEFTGAVKRLSPGAEVSQNVGTKQPKTSKIAAQLKAQDMEKPQLLFEHVPSNQEKGPFKPLLENKPHALVPLDTAPVATDEDSQLQYPHPYQLEIENYRYPTSVYTQSDPIPYHPFDSTTATFVDTEEAVDEMLQELKGASEIAIDLEHHDHRSYIGIVSLMQISTRDRDWIVDTLKPWRRKLQNLNEVFADPSIIKVLHGAYMDIVWLQRDLGLYIVGLFDTHYAARALGYAGGSLAFLLKKFANVDAQKQYQTADWRIRPLPQELFDYARSDTHYLLYIYDCMRNELIQRSDFSDATQERDKLWDVLQKSSETALQRYEYPVYDSDLGLGPMGWYNLLKRTPALLTKEQFSVFKAIHRWRDNVAREQDDSLHFVMPNYQIFSMAKEMPTNRAAVLGLAQPTSQTVRLRGDELVSVIVKAKEDGKNGPELLDTLNRVEPHNARGVIANTKAAPAPSHSVAAYLPKTNALANGSAPLGLRSETSSFWGGAFESSIRDQRRMASTVGDISLSVPMPPLTAEVFMDPAEVANSTPIRPSFVATQESESSPAQNSKDDDDVFVLKDLGKKRKRASSAMDANITPVDGMAAQEDEVGIDEETDHRLEKAKKKQAKKAAKKAAKFASSSSGPNGAEAQEEPFDYASAPSILNPPREDPREKREKKTSKSVNPYAKALDAPKGLPRNPASKERAGRSMTYK